MSNQTTFGRFVWILIFLLMLGLGNYLCFEAYQNWMAQPVMTTIIASQVPLKQVKSNS
jgi:hypothetical protein